MKDIFSLPFLYFLSIFSAGLQNVSRWLIREHFTNALIEEVKHFSLCEKYFLSDFSLSSSSSSVFILVSSSRSRKSMDSSKHWFSESKHHK